MKLYDTKTERIISWDDNTGHRPYCLSRNTPEEIRQLIKGRPEEREVIAILEEEKKDLINDTTITIRKILTSNPLTISGPDERHGFGQGKAVGLRNLMPTWESSIKYFENYLYDRQLRVGTYYSIKEGNLVAIPKPMPANVATSLESIIKKAKSAQQIDYIKRWAELLGQPIPQFKRIALDIEVANELNRVPDPEHAERQVISVAFYNNEEQIVYILQRDKLMSPNVKPYVYQLFASEKELLEAVFRKISDYPFLVGFNSDEFDLAYLKGRGKKLGIKDEDMPFQVSQNEVGLKDGIHIDLYRFYHNKSIQVYIYGQKYKEFTLEAIAEALLGKHKIPFDGAVGDLPLDKLAEYNLNDAQLTYELTSINNSLMMSVLVIMARISNMPFNDVSRTGISSWARSSLYSDHRRIGALIPRQDELKMKGGASTTATIKGKKYKGALVMETENKIYFNVSVLDFASLAYNEQIFVRKLQTGEVYKVKIGDFVEQYLKAGTGFAAKQLGLTWDVLSFDYNAQRASWKKVTAVIRHPSQTDMIDVITESGRHVNITKGHSLISLDSKGKRATIRGGDLKIGDYVVAMSSFPIEQQNTSLDLLPYLEQLTDYEIGRGTKWKVTQSTRVALKTTYNKYNTRRLVVQRYLNLSTDLMWALGYWLAEGYNPPKNKTGRQLVIDAASHDIAFTKAKFNAAGFDVTVFKSKTDGCSTLQVNGRYEDGVVTLPSTVFAKLVDLWFGNHAKNKKVADWMFQLPLEFRLAFIDGYYRGDGYQPNRRYEFVTNDKYKTGSYSQRLINDLMSLGLVSGLHCFSKNINRKESYLTWSGGTQVRAKAKRCNPELLVRTAHVEAFADTPYYYNRKHLPPRYERANKRSVEKCVPQYEKFYNGDCHFERVKEINQIKNTMPVYDISVDIGQSFFNSDGILVSNSLYPSLVGNHNLSYETVNCNHPECKTEANQIPETTHWECKKREGIISLNIGSLRELRVHHYKDLVKDKSLSQEERELYDAASQGLKVFLNASIGAMSFESFELYCLPVGESTTALGRYSISKVIDKCKDIVLEVIFSDTDSAAVVDATPEQIKTMMDWSNSELGLELELDKTYRYVALSGLKKNYFGVLPSGKVDIKGLTSKKRQTPKFFKDTSSKVLDVLSKINTPTDIEPAKIEIKAILRDMVRRLKARDVPIADLAFHMAMSKDIEGYQKGLPQHVRAAKLMEEAEDKETVAGEVISFVKTIGGEKVKPTSMAKKEDINIEKYLEYAENMFNQILDPFGVSFEEILGASTLDGFWS